MYKKKPTETQNYFSVNISKRNIWGATLELLLGHENMQFEFTRIHLLCLALKEGIGIPIFWWERRINSCATQHQCLYCFVFVLRQRAILITVLACPNHLNCRARSLRNDCSNSKCLKKIMKTWKFSFYKTEFGQTYFNYFNKME